jgi:hypothetical protein
MQCNVVPTNSGNDAHVTGAATLTGKLSVTMTGTFTCGTTYTLLHADNGLGVPFSRAFQLTSRRVKTSLRGSITITSRTTSTFTLRATPIRRTSTSITIGPLLRRNRLTFFTHEFRVSSRIDVRPCKHFAMSEARWCSKNLWELLKLVVQAVRQT